MPACRTFLLTLLFASQLISHPLLAAAQVSARDEQSPRKITLLQALAEIGLRTRQSLGIVVGEDQTALCKPRTGRLPSDLTTREAVEELAELARYTVEEHDGVLVLIAPDITKHQRDLLLYRTERFEETPKQTMRMQSSDLTGWLWLAADGGGGYGTSLGDAVKVYAITIPPLTHVTTEQIANQAVTIGAGGIWVLRASATAAKVPGDDRIDFLSYAEPQWMMSAMSCE
jgi:hypothetical protein